MEDFEIVSPQELVNIVMNMRLCDNSISGFSEREEYFLREIDTLYNLPVKHKHKLHHAYQTFRANTLEDDH